MSAAVTSPTTRTDPDTDDPSSEWTTLVTGRSYHYVTAGAEHAPALLFLHGYTDSWRSAELVMPHLARRFRIFALDQRGHGDSDADFDRFSLDDFAADAVDFIQSVIEGPVTLVGHSLGSLVAQRIAANHPTLVARLVLIGSTDTSGGNRAIAELCEALAALVGPIPYAFARAFQESTLAKPISRERLETFVRESLKLRPGVWRKVAAALRDDHDVVAARITAPTLILWGERDGVFDGAAQRRLKALLRQSKFIAYPEVGHAPNWEIPEVVARDILAFSLQ